MLIELSLNVVANGFHAVMIPFMVFDSSNGSRIIGRHRIKPTIAVFIANIAFKPLFNNVLRLIVRLSPEDSTVFTPFFRLIL